MVLKRKFLKFFWEVNEFSTKILVSCQGSIAVGNFADMVVWEPEVEFNLNEEYPVHIKHPVSLPSFHFSYLMMFN